MSICNVPITNAQIAWARSYFTRNREDIERLFILLDAIEAGRKPSGLGPGLLAASLDLDFIAVELSGHKSSTVLGQVRDAAIKTIELMRSNDVCKF